MAYVELHCHSYFSLLDGASSPEDLVERAVALGMDALALTDHDAVYGAPRFVRAARAAGIRPILGAELTLHDGHHLTLLVQDTTGWSNLCALITAARHNAVKGEAALPQGLLAEHTAGLIALSGCRQGTIPSALRTHDDDRALAAAQHLCDLFGRERCWIELQQHWLPEDQRLNRDLAALAEQIGVGVVATNNVHYATRAHQPLQDVLVCIRHNSTLEDTPPLRPNSEYYLKSGAELAPLFARYPDALANTHRVAAACDFDLQYGLQTLPVFPTPDGLDADVYLRRLCQAALTRYALPAADQLEYELRIIAQSGLSNYFLVVWDIVRFATENGILCQGRGSAANSLVAYLLGITPINPLEHHLVFERFLSAERQVVPDIDIDFDATQREEVIQYVYGRYGLEHAAMACTFVTFRARSAIRDVGKALGLPLDLLDHVTATLDVRGAGSLADSPSLHDVLGDDLHRATWQQALALCGQIDGLPRHLGIHNGGMVVTCDPLAGRVPVEPATMADRSVVQWDKDGLEDIGLVKIDLLGLRMLSAVAEAVSLIEYTTGQRPDLAALAYDDPQVYDMLCEADTVGVFQVESRAQAQVLPRLRPRCFADLVMSISLIRPGPVQGDMVHPYLRRRLGEEPVRYLHPDLEPALRETLGVILFQEQVLLVARDLAGFTAGEGELLRRALSGKQPQGIVDRLRQAFIRGAMARGVAAETAAAVFGRLEAFGGYSFPKSHAAAFAVLVYRSAWLKRYHPAPFYVALLNNQPMGFWSPAVLVSDAKRHGIAVKHVDIQCSESRCSVEDDGLRLGFNTVRGISEALGEHIVMARLDRPFADLRDLRRRTGLARRLVENLIAAGALDGWDQSRRAILWELGMTEQTPDRLDLAFAAEPVSLPALSATEALALEITATGVTTGDHPLASYRAHLRSQGILDSHEVQRCASGQSVRVAGWVVVHQSPPTAKGFHFVTLEDERGFFNVIVRPAVYARFRRVLRTQPVLIVAGMVEREGAVANVMAGWVGVLDE